MAWGNGSFALHSEGMKASKKRLYREATCRRKEAQRKVMEYARRIVYLSSEGVGRDPKQQTDMIASERDA